jgi:hypothetical protein
MGNPLELAKRIKEYDPSLLPDFSAEQVAQSLQDPLAAGAFYDTLKQRHPQMVDVERDSFVQQVSGKKPIRKELDPEKLHGVSQRLKQTFPEFKGNVSAEALTDSWVSGGDMEKVYRDLSEIPGFVDMGFEAFQEMMSKDDKHPEVKENPKKKSTFFSQEAPEPKAPETPITGDEDPLGWGIRNMGNYDDRMTLYDGNDKAKQMGRFKIGGEAIRKYEEAASNSLTWHAKQYDKRVGDGAFEELMADYSNMMLIASMNPDRQKADKEIQAFMQVNKARLEDPDVKAALSAMRGSFKASDAKKRLAQQNPEEYARIVELQDRYDNPTWMDQTWLARGLDFAFRAGARGMKNAASFAGSDYLHYHAENALDRHKPQYGGKKGAYSFLTKDAEGNKIALDPETRSFIAAYDQEGNEIKDYEVSNLDEIKFRTSKLDVEFNPTETAFMVGEVVGDLIIDAVVTRNVFSIASKLGAASKLATGIGVVSAGALRSYDASFQTALEAGRSRGEANMDAAVKSALIGAVSLINPLESQLAARIFSNAPAKALNQAIARYTTGKVTWTDMLKELGGGVLKSAAGESIEEFVQDHVVERGWNSVVYGDKFELNPHDIAETLIISSIVGAAGSTLAKGSWSKDRLMVDAMNIVLNNPDKVQDYLEGVRQVDPEFADLKAPHIAKVMQQVEALKPSENVKAKVATALLQRNAYVDIANNKDLPETSRKMAEAVVAEIDIEIDELLNGKKEPERPAAEVVPVEPAVEGELTAVPEEVEPKGKTLSDREIGEDAHLLGKSKNHREVADFEEWRQRSLDRKPAELSDAERAVFGDKLDDNKTIREQLGDKAGMPKLDPKRMPEDPKKMSEFLAKLPGFTMTSDIAETVDTDGNLQVNEAGEPKKQIGRKRLMLSKLRKDGGRDTDLNYYGEEYDKKISEVYSAIQKIKNEGGTVADLRKEFDKLNVQFGPFEYLNRSGQPFIDTDYQDAAFEAMLGYQEPTKPKANEKITLKVDKQDKTFTWNAESDKWIDDEGKEAKGLIKGRLTRAFNASQKSKAVGAVAAKIAQGKKLTDAEQKLADENKKDVDKIVAEKKKTAEKVEKKPTAKKGDKDTKSSAEK